MEIIDELEPHRRGPYGGAVGYVDFSGNMDTCIALRTMVLHGQTAYVQAGAGLVADSVPAARVPGDGEQGDGPAARHRGGRDAVVGEPRPQGRWVAAHRRRDAPRHPPPLRAGFTRRCPCDPFSRSWWLSRAGSRSRRSRRSRSCPATRPASSGFARPRCRRSTSRSSFDTPEADAILSALEVFPADNPWNLVVSDWPLHPNSKKIVASIGADKPLRYNPDMGFVLVPPDQKKIDLKLVELPGRVRQGAVPDPGQRAHRGLAGALQPQPEAEGHHARRRAARQAEGERRPARDRGRSDQPDAVRVLPAQEDGRRAGRPRARRRSTSRATSSARTGGPVPTRPGCRSSPPSSATTN